MSSRSSENSLPSRSSAVMRARGGRLISARMSGRLRQPSSSPTISPDSSSRGLMKARSGSP